MTGLITWGGDDPRGAYLALMNTLVDGGSESPVDGGYESPDEDQTGLFYGGKETDANALDELKKYRSSKAAMMKTKIVKDIISALSKLNLTAESGRIEDVLKIIPNPREESFPKDAETQSAICKAVAESINSTIGTVIDTSAPSEVICRSIFELVESLQSGVQWEFLKVHNKVEKTLEEMQTAFAIMRESFARFLDNVADDTEFTYEAEKFKELYRQAEREFELRIQILNGLLNTDILPAKDELKVALEYEKADNKVIRNLKLTPGTSDFGDSIAWVIHKTATTGALTNKLNKALKKVGLTIEEYMGSKSMRALDDKIEDLRDNLLHKYKGKKFPKELDKFDEGVEELRKLFGKMKQNKAYKSIGGAATLQRRTASETRAERLAKKMDVRKKAKIIFLRQFTRGLYEKYDDVLKAVTTLGPKIGRELPVGPQVERLIDAFKRLASRDLRSQNMDISLIGLRNDIQGREVKDSFIATLRLIQRRADECNSPTLAPIKSAVEGVISYINKYNELRRLKFGAAELTDAQKTADAASSEGAKKYLDSLEKIEDLDAKLMGDATWEGSDVASFDAAKIGDYFKDESGVGELSPEAELKLYEDDLAAKGKLAEEREAARKEKVDRDQRVEKILSEMVKKDRETETKPKTETKAPSSHYGGGVFDHKPSFEDYKPKDFFKLDEAIGKMVYYYYVANVRSNLQKNATELSVYANKYETTLAEAMRVKRDEIADAKSKALEDLDKDRDTLNFKYTVMVAGNEEERTVDLMNEDQYESIKEFITITYDAKDNLYRAIEAIELYLKDYTAVVTKSPDIIKDLQKVLEGNNNIFNWFNEKTGDHLAQAFDGMPSREFTKKDGNNNPANEHVNFITPNEAHKKIQDMIAQVSQHATANNKHYYQRFLRGILNSKDVQDLLHEARVDEPDGRGAAFAGVSWDHQNPETPSWNPPNHAAVAPPAGYGSHYAYPLAGDPTLPLYDQKKIAKVQESLDYALNNFQALQNMMNSFIMIASLTKSGEGREIMPPRQIYKYLLNYIIASSVAMGIKSDQVTVLAPAGLAQREMAAFQRNDNGPAQGKFSTNFASRNVVLFEYPKELIHQMRRAGQDIVYKKDGNVTVPDAAEIAAVGRAGAMVSKAADVTKHIQDLKKTYDKYQVMFGVAPVHEQEGRYRFCNDTFEEDNMFFSFAVKAMMGKILVSIGLYDLLERDAPLKEMPHTRYILGGNVTGGDDLAAEKPKVIPEIAELYYRIPRLMELYRQLLEYDNQNDEMIALLIDPEMKYSEFFSMVFDELNKDDVERGSYTDLECYRIIKYINEIYEENKDIRKSIDAIYNEVNRRYGIISKNEVSKLKKLRVWRKINSDIDSYTEASTNLIDILPQDEGLGEFSSVPSDNYILPEVYQTPAQKQMLQKNLKRTLHRLDSKANLDQYNAIKKFRLGVEKTFKGMDLSRYTRNVYNNIIDQAKRDMVSASDDVKLRMAIKLITNDHKSTTLDSRKLMMFHESVVFGLNVLNGILSTVRSYATFLDSIDLDKFRKYVVKKLKTFSELYAADMAGVQTAMPNKNSAITAVNLDTMTHNSKVDIDWCNETHVGGYAAVPAHFPIVINPNHEDHSYNEALNEILKQYVMGPNECYYGRGGLNPRMTRREMMHVISRLPIDNDDQINVFADVLIRFMFKNKEMMKDIILNVFNFSSDLNGLVDVEFNDGENKLGVNFSKLRETVESLLRDVRKYLEVFRNYLPDDVIREYEHGSTDINGASNPREGSLYYLEREFMDKLFRNTEIDYEYTDRDSLPPTLAQIHRGLNKTIAILTKEWKDSDPANPKNLFDPTDATKVRFFIPYTYVMSGATGFADFIGGVPAAGAGGVVVVPYNRLNNLPIVHEFILEQRKLPTHNLSFLLMNSGAKLVTPIGGGAGMVTNALLNHHGIAPGTVGDPLYLALSNVRNEASLRYLTRSAAPAWYIDANEEVDQYATPADFNTYQRTVIDKQYKKDEYGQVISELLHYNILKDNSGFDVDATDVNKLIHRPIDAVPPPAPGHSGVVVRDNAGADTSYIQHPQYAAAPNPPEDFNTKLSNLLYERVIIDNRTGRVAPATMEVKNFLVAGGQSFSRQKNDPRLSKMFEANTHILHTYNLDGQITRTNSVFFLFNQYIMYFIRAFFDRNTNKIYAPLVKQFIGGPLSVNISSALQTDYDGLFPDLVNDSGSFTTFGQRTDLSQNVALLQSIAVVIKNLVETKGLDGAAFIIQNSVEVPGHIKDIMRANLPTFIKMFEYISKFCEFIRGFIEGTKINISRYEVKHFLDKSVQCASLTENGLPSSRAGAGVIAAAFAGAPGNPVFQVPFKVYAADTCMLHRPRSANAAINRWIHPLFVSVVAAAGNSLAEPILKGAITPSMRRFINWNAFLNIDDMQFDHDGSKNRFNAIITTLTTPIDIMQSTCRDVLRELVDERVYMDIYDKFVANYKLKNNGKLPIMPLSSTLYHLRNIRTDKELNRLMPTTNVSDPSFKLYYGTRQITLYNDKIDLAKFPYAKVLVDNFNTAVSENDKITVENYLNFMEKSVTLMKYMTDATFFKGIYGVKSNLHENSTDPQFVLESKLRMYAATRIGDDVLPAAQSKLLVYQLQNKDMTKTVDISETIDQKRTLENVTEKITISSADVTDNRKQEQRFNLIDLNMIPINPSALMREIPLTNIYNYSYTLENMLASMFGADPARIWNLKLDNTVQGIPPVYRQDSTGTAIATGAPILNAAPVPNAPHVLRVQPNANPVSPKDVFLKLLFNPYAAVSMQQVYGVPYWTGGILAPLQRIFRGDNSLNLGTPKFLSDQLFNKILFQSVYPRGEAAYDEEGGPIYSLGRLLDAPDRNSPYLGTANVMRSYDPDAINSQAGQSMVMSFPYRDNSKNKNAFKIATVNISTRLYSALYENGYDRFNTNVVRNMFFITNLYRVLRLKLNQELVQNRSMIVSSNNLVNPSITEYGAGSNGHTEVFSDNAIDSTYRGMSKI